MVTKSMRKRRAGSAAVVSLALMAGSAVTAGFAPGTASAVETTAGTRLVAKLAGTSTGDPDGTGRAVLRLFKAKRMVCARVTWENIEPPTAAHIHRRSDGGVVVDLTGSVTGGPRCARDVPRADIRRVAAHPRRYYFNVHNATYPAGAIQGTLRR